MKNLRMRNHHNSQSGFVLPYWIICLLIALATIIVIVTFATFENLVFRSVLIVFLVVFLIALFLNPSRRYGRIGSLLAGGIVGLVFKPSFVLVVPCDKPLGTALQWVLECSPDTGFRFESTEPPAVVYPVMGALAAVAFVLDYLIRERSVESSDAELKRLLKTAPRKEIVTLTEKTVLLRGALPEEPENGEDN